MKEKGSDKLSFTKILKRRGAEISQIQIIRTNIDGYVDTSENITTVNATIQPLSQEERLFWSEAGIEKAVLKLFIDGNINVGDKITLNNENYTVIAVDSHEDAKISGYTRVIVEKHG